MDSFPSEKWTVIQLKTFLRSKNQPVSGNKPHLLGLAKLYAQDFDDQFNPNPEALSKCEATYITKRKIFDDPQILSWINIETQKAPVPKDFNIDFINEFLTSTTFRFGEFDDEEVISSGTEKPAKKGRLMYSSSKIQLCEFAILPDLVLFRCVMEASYKKNEFRYV
jgi:hypothetical protein